MPTEHLAYHIPSDGTNNGSDVNLTLTYSDTANADGSFTVIGAFGTYQVLLPNGSTRTDNVTGVGPINDPDYGGDNELFVGTQPYVTANGLNFTIDSNPDSDNGSGLVNFYSDNGTSPPTYFEANQNALGADNVTESSACYRSGTLVATDMDDVAVENLRLGDFVRTANGSLRQIRWLGHRTIDCRRHPRPLEAHPIRISANAFGENRPARDLYVSPGHAICVDVFGEVLIPAIALVNGSTVQQVEVDTVTYWHVGLTEHNILLAENLPAESYIDCGNRAFFVEAGVVDLAAHPDARHATTADYCRPYHAEGQRVEAVRAQLHARAATLGNADRCTPTPQTPQSAQHRR